MELLPSGQGSSALDAKSEHVRLVSLGHNCGPKLSFQYLGRGAETLPFDWNRTKIQGILNFMRNDFEGFFDFVTQQPVPGIDGMVMYRNVLHSFWHDNPTDAGMQERYARRIARFNAIDARQGPVLFVRVPVALDELARAEELIEELRMRFGEDAYLLIVINDQATAHGAGIVEMWPNVLIYFLEADAHDIRPRAPYSEAVKVALDWIIGKPIAAMKFPTLKAINNVMDPLINGLGGLGGLRPFEEDVGAVAVAHAKVEHLEVESSNRAGGSADLAKTENDSPSTPTATRECYAAPSCMPEDTEVKVPRFVTPAVTAPLRHQVGTAAAVILAANPVAGCGSPLLRSAVPSALHSSPQVMDAGPQLAFSVQNEGFHHVLKPRLVENRAWGHAPFQQHYHGGTPSPFSAPLITNQRPYATTGSFIPPAVGSFQPLVMGSFKPPCMGSYQPPVMGSFQPPVIVQRSPARLGG